MKLLQFLRSVAPAAVIVGACLLVAYSMAQQWFGPHIQASELAQMVAEETDQHISRELSVRLVNTIAELRGAEFLVCAILGFIILIAGVIWLKS